MRLQPEHPLCNLLLLLDLLASNDLYDPGLLQSLQVAEKIFLVSSRLALQGGSEAEEGNDTIGTHQEAERFHGRR